MQPPLERKLQAKILKALRTRGGYWTNTHGSPMTKRGQPDIIGCYRGRYIGFEVKRDETKQLTPLQAFRVEEIRRAGGIALRIWTVEQAIAILDRIDERRRPRSQSSS